MVKRMAVIFTDVVTDSSAWIVGVLGISVMAFFLGCASCRQHKPREGADRRPPPPTPEAEHGPRYQGELFPPTAVPSAAHSFPNLTRDDDNDYEDDFEECKLKSVMQQGASKRTPPYAYVAVLVPTPIMKEQSNKSLRNSLSSQESTRVTAARCSVESEEKVSLSESRCHSYENVVHNSLASVPVMRKDHTYLEVFPSNGEMELELPTADKGITAAIRSSVESEGKVSMLSQSSLHCYENVINANGSPSSTASELEGDYVNLMDQ